MLSLPKLTKYEGKEVIPNMGLISLLHDKLEYDAWYCNIPHFLILVPIVPEFFWDSLSLSHHSFISEYLVALLTIVFL